MPDDEEQSTEETAEQTPEPEVMPPDLDSVHESYDPGKIEDLIDKFED